MWVLVYIVLQGTMPVAVNAMGPTETFETINECFVAREKLSATVGGNEGYFPTGSQAVCVQVDRRV